MKKILAFLLAASCYSSSLQAIEPLRFNLWDPSTYYDPGCPCHRYWFNAEWLYWQINPSKGPPPLVITGPTTLSFPVLGQPGTDVLVGGENIHNSWRSGGKATLGCWLDCDYTYGLEFSYFFIPHGSKKSSAKSDGHLHSRVLAAPFFDVLSGTESSTGIAYPLSFSGKAHLKVSNSMQGGEINFVIDRDCGDCCDLNFLAGARYWNFNEQLIFKTSSPFLFINDTWMTEDKFTVRNNFYGAQLGVDATWHCCCCFLEGAAKIAAGAMCEQVSVHGELFTNDYNHFGGVLEYPGGYYALKTNSGHHKKTAFAVIPEAEVSFGFCICSFLNVRFGYSIMYVSNVLYAGNQIDRNINPTQATSLTGNTSATLMGEARPKPKTVSSTMWVQGAKACLEYTF